MGAFGGSRIFQPRWLQLELATLFGSRVDILKCGFNAPMRCDIRGTCCGVDHSDVCFYKLGVFRGPI